MNKLKFNKTFLDFIKYNYLNIIDHSSYFNNSNNIKFTIGSSSTNSNIQNNNNNNNVSYYRYYYLITLFFNDLENYCKYDVLRKLLFYKDNNFDFMNLNEYYKMYKLYLFNMLQKIHININKLIFIFKTNKRRKNIIYYNNSNLLLNNFNKDIFSLYFFNNNNKVTCFKFDFNDLYSLCETNFVHYDEDFNYDNIDHKNPYNNISFKYHELINIYFFLVNNQNKSIKKINLFFNYFKSNFNKELFMLHNDNMLRHENIKNYYYNNINNIILFKKIIKKCYPLEINLNLLPNNIINDFFYYKKSIIYDYLISFYSYDDSLSDHHSHKLSEKLYRTLTLNPLLGRIYFITNENGEYIKKIHYGNNLY